MRVETQARLIRALLSARGETLAELAARMGGGHSGLTLALRRGSLPRQGEQRGAAPQALIFTVDAVASALGVPVEVLLGAESVTLSLAEGDEAAP